MSKITIELEEQDLKELLEWFDMCIDFDNAIDLLPYSALEAIEEAYRTRK